MSSITLTVFQWSFIHIDCYNSSTIVHIWYRWILLDIRRRRYRSLDRRHREADRYFIGRLISLEFSCHGASLSWMVRAYRMIRPMGIGFWQADEHAVYIPGRRARLYKRTYDRPRSAYLNRCACILRGRTGPSRGGWKFYVRRWNTSFTSSIIVYWTIYRLL